MYILLLDGNSGYLFDSKAFLFSLVNKPGWDPLKLPVKSGYESYAILSTSSYGPTFGAGHDLFIGDDYISGNYLGHSYSPPPGHKYNTDFTKTFLAGKTPIQPSEVETYYESK